MKKFYNGMAVIEVRMEGELDRYDLGNCQDIFGRCLEPSVGFARIEQVFDEVWQKGDAIEFDELNKRMYAIHL